MGDQHPQKRMPPPCGTVAAHKMGSCKSRKLDGRMPVLGMGHNRSRCW
jgi:hypothetical protein